MTTGQYRITTAACWITDSLDSFPEPSLVDDRIVKTDLIAFGTGYDLMQGDTAFNTIFHITKDYYDYYESVQLAVVGDLNPFAQPSPHQEQRQWIGQPLGYFHLSGVRSRYDDRRTIRPTDGISGRWMPDGDFSWRGLFCFMWRRCSIFGPNFFISGYQKTHYRLNVIRSNAQNKRQFAWLPAGPPADPWRLQPH